MGLVGMRTQSIYSRYAIKLKQDLKDGVAKLAKLHEVDAALPVRWFRCGLREAA
jgi:hypothetical protein